MYVVGHNLYAPLTNIVEIFEDFLMLVGELSSLLGDFLGNMLGEALTVVCNMLRETPTLLDNTLGDIFTVLGHLMGNMLGDILLETIRKLLHCLYQVHL